MFNQPKFPIYTLKLPVTLDFSVGGKMVLVSLVLQLKIKGGSYMKKFKKLTAGLLGVVMAMSVCSLTALADDEKTKYIATSAELVDAIKNQEDGQTWILEGETYDLKDEVLTYTKDKEKFEIDGDNNGFVFPIVVDNLTIKGEKGTVITSSYVAPENTGGNWHLQNFITISGSNVTIQDVDIKGNPNNYFEYDGTCNKAIELVGNAKDFKLENVEILPLKDTNGKVNSGSIYFSNTDAGNTVLKDVKLYSWISGWNIADGSVTVDNVELDLTENRHSGDNEYSYSVNVPEDSTKVDGLKIVVDKSCNIDEQVFNNNLKNGATIELENGTYELKNKIRILKDVEIVGNDSTLKYVGDSVYKDRGNGSFIDVMNGADVTVEDLILDGNNGEKPLVRHGFNVFTGSNDDTAKLTLKNVEIKDCGAYAIQNTSSDVTVKDITTSGNGWGGIGVDNKYNVADADFVMESGNITEETSVKIEKSTYGEGEQLTTKATIKGGTFEGKIEAKENSLLNIKGGTFEGEVEADSKDNLTITSGTFKTDVSDYMDEESHLVKDDNGNYVIMDEEKYEGYLDSKRPSHSYSLEEGRVDRNDEEEEPVVTTKPEEEAGPFSDVGKDNPNYDAIIKVYEKGWMAGIGDGVFAPNGTLTRAMGATVLWNKAGKPEPQNVAPFLDVTSDAWYAKAVAWAYEQGIVAGYGETFGPGDALTTEQFTRMNDIANGKTPEIYVGGAPNATRGWVASLLAM